MMSYMVITAEPKHVHKIARELAHFECTVDKLLVGEQTCNIIARVVTDNEGALHKFIQQEVTPIKGVRHIARMVLA